MHITRFFASAVLGGACAVTQAATLATDTFESGIDGWQTANGATSPVFSSVGGDPGGFVSATDTVFGATLWYWTAPASFSGDFSGAYGGDLSFSLKASRTTSGGQSAPDVKIVGANGVTLVVDAGPNPGLSWTHYSVAFTPGAWHLGTLSGSVATQADILAVLSNVNSLWIRGDYSPLTRGASSSLDSVSITSAVPEPQSWALWLGGLLAVGSLARRRQI